MRARAVLGLLAALVAACGGKVVVDVAGGAGGGGAGGGAASVTNAASSSSTGTGPCVATVAPGNAVITVCVSMNASGGCQQDELADKTAQLMQVCPNDPLCGCAFVFVSAPCPPSAGCCYNVEATPTPTVCQ